MQQAEPGEYQCILAAADKEIAELEAEAVALKADLARAVEERDDYRAKAIQRQQDFDGAAHACDVLQGKLDKVTEERERVKALIGEWRLNEYGEFSNITWAFRKCADQLAAILAESESEPQKILNPHAECCCLEFWASHHPECPKMRPSLPLGHEFTPYKGYFVESSTCMFLGCGQPRSAHE